MALARSGFAPNIKLRAATITAAAFHERHKQCLERGQTRNLNLEMGFSAKTVIKRSDFGFASTTERIADEVGVEVEGR